jgi:hypothetical protein
MGCLTGNPNDVDEVAVTPDGWTVVTGGYPAATVWDRTAEISFTAHLTSYACAAAGQPLTPAEWAQAAPGLAYIDACP